MEMCLYEPELGYYARPREQFGKAGDFYTSSDVHAVFGRLLARQFEEMWRVLGSPERIGLIELGPGRGLFAADVLDWSAKQFPEFAKALRYSLVEQSEHLRARLRERLAEHVDAGRVQVFDSLESAGIEAPASHLSSLRDSGLSPTSPSAESAGLRSAAPPARVSSELEPIDKPDEDASSRRERHSLAQHEGEAGMLGGTPQKFSESRRDGTQAPPLILFANEFFDALPVEIVDHRGAARVAEEQGSFIEQFVTPSSAELDYIDRYSVHPEEHERVEVSLAALDWIDRIAQLFHRRRGFAMFVDYGYTREEQLAGRHRDTLMTYHRHRASASPYGSPGEQDITAHVNFTALRLPRRRARSRRDCAGDADAAPARHRRRNPVRGCVSGVQAAAGASQGRVAVAPPAVARGDGREVPRAVAVARSFNRRGCAVERREMGSIGGRSSAKPGFQKARLQEYRHALCTLPPFSDCSPPGMTEMVSSRCSLKQRPVKKSPGEGTNRSSPVLVLAIGNQYAVPGIALAGDFNKRDGELFGIDVQFFLHHVGDAPHRPPFLLVRTAFQHGYLHMGHMSSLVERRFHYISAAPGVNVMDSAFRPALGTLFTLRSLSFRQQLPSAAYFASSYPAKK